MSKAKGKIWRMMRCRAARQEAKGKINLRSFRLTRYRYSLLLFSFCLLPFAFLFAASQPSLNLHQWGAVSLFHGLPSNHVRAIAQDGDRIMWFGTDSGLVKYDGRRIQRLATEGMLAGRVRAIRIDQDGVLWVGTDDGAARIVGGEIKPVSETEGKTVTAIINPEGGRAIFATAEGVIFDCSTNPDGSLEVEQVGPEERALLNIDQGDPLQLTSLAIAGNTLLVGTRSRGLLSIERAAIKEAPVKEVLSRARAFFVEAIETDTKGRAWFGAQTTAQDSGLFDGADILRPAKVGAGTGTVLALKFAPGGDLWVGTDGQGAFRYRNSRRVERFTFENTAGGLRSNHIYSVFVDAEGVVWFGTDRGVCRYDPQSPHIEKVSDDPESNFARALFQSSDNALWCGTNRGLFVRREGSEWVAVKELAGRTVHSIAEEAEGRLLVGTSAGLFRSNITAGDRSFERVESEPGGDVIRAICRFQGATYVAAFGRGVERLEGARRTLIWPLDGAKERERQVISLHAEGNRLWIGTVEAGVHVFDGRQVEESLSKLKAETVRAFAGVKDDGVWLATARGLYLLRGEQLLPVVKGVDVRSIAAAANAGWCATAGGLYRVMVSREGSAIVARLDTEQGLPSQNAFAVISTQTAGGGETLWAATSRGVVHYEPGRTPPRIAVTRVMGRRVYSAEEIGAGLDLEYPQSSLSFDVAATGSRTFPEQFQYSFSVFDQENRLIAEKLSRDSQLLMDNLRPGRHRLEVRAFTNDLVASEPLTFEFNVARAPFPWTTTALSVLLMLALVAVWWGWRQNRRIIRTNRQLAETRMQLANETEAERRRIARDLHDQTLADLRRLMLLADRLPSTEATNGQRQADPSTFRGEIESISTEIRRICEDLSPSALANVGLAAALEYALANAVAHLPPDKKFDYEIARDSGLEERLALAPAVQIQIYRIVQEAVSNISRHSKATRVRMEILINPAGELIVLLKDNGKGFDPRKNGARSGRGLANIRSRASLIEAEVSWSNLDEGGTIFTLRKVAATSPTLS